MSQTLLLCRLEGVVVSIFTSSPGPSFHTRHAFSCMHRFTTQWEKLAHYKILILVPKKFGYVASVEISSHRTQISFYESESGHFAHCALGLLSVMHSMVIDRHRVGISPFMFINSTPTKVTSKLVLHPNSSR